MKKIIFTFFLFPVFIYAQNSRVIDIEDLSKPEALLKLTHNNELLEEIVREEAHKNNKSLPDDFDYAIFVKSHMDDSLVGFGRHPFFQGMYKAYAQHRPFVLSPDILWLLVSQGFAQHVKANAEQLRSKFVKFDGKVDLVIDGDKTSVFLSSPAEDWERLFPVITSEMSKHVGDELTNTLTSDFTTTNPASRVASQITMMKSMESFFNYITISTLCGIPQITLEGTPDDWRKVREKAQFLRQYDLDWWIDEIDPIFENIIKAAEGETDVDFWRNMFKYHKGNLISYALENRERDIDGWIIKFFPYSENGGKYNFKFLNTNNSLPGEMVNVDLKYLVIQGGRKTTTNLELWAGFVGLTQDKETFALRPQIGWMIRNKRADNLLLAEKFRELSKSSDGIGLRVSEFPQALLRVKRIEKLNLMFTEQIDIPDNFRYCRVKTMFLSGRIDKQGINRLIRLFPNTQLFINGKGYGLAKDKTEP